MQTVKTNIVMTYPVKWSVYSMISNFVQNFYDLLGAEHFMQGFHYELQENGDLVMSSSGGFAKEWLFFLGASTKRTQAAETAGGFGEGFKIASLIAIRDYHLNVTMKSRDWILHVTTLKDNIAEQEQEFLAYDIDTKPYENNSVLILGNAGGDLLEKTESILLDYYYQGNPRFGECLASGENYAIYKAVFSENDIKKKRKRPESGYLYASYQRRGYMRIPLVICNHRYHSPSDDRDRKNFSSRYATECIREVIQKISAENAWDILQYLDFLWSGIRKSYYREPDWSQIIEDLINIVYYSEDQTYRKKFQSRYVGKLIIRDTDRITPDKNRRMMAMVWYQKSSFHGNRRFVEASFYRLGVKTVCELCEENDGYTAERLPGRTESRCIRVLRRSAEDVLDDLLILKKENWPECHILVNPRAPVAGYTRVHEKRGSSNSYGMTVCAEASYIYLQEWQFQKGGFAKAFVTYAHELLHQFGGDSSLQFHKALRIMNVLILNHMEVLNNYEEEWDRIEQTD